MTKRTVYLDNAATTPCDPLVVEAMIPYYSKEYGNPSASYEFGYMGKMYIDEAKRKIAKLVNCSPGGIYFTSGGSESDNWALRGVLSPGDHLITSEIEHHAILNTCKYLENIGVEVDYLDVDKNGLVDLDQIKSFIRSNTKLISVMYANNEVGTIQPIPEICEIAHKNGILFHTDAVQIVGHQLIDVRCGIDLLSSSAHKLNGPKGIGFLYIRDGVNISPLIFGGSQQNGLRAGTENVPGIVGFGVAADISYREWEQRYVKCVNLAGYLEKRLTEIPGVNINGNRNEVLKLSNIVSASFKGIRAEALLVMLEMYGIYVSTGSACNNSSGEPSHVLIAMGLSEEEADSTIRFSLSHLTTKDDIDYVVDVLCQCVAQLRSVNKHE